MRNDPAPVRTTNDGTKLWGAAARLGLHWIGRERQGTEIRIQAARCRRVINARGEPETGS